MPNNTRPSRMVTLEEKRDYYNRVKLKNYRDNMRLEGFNVEYTPLPPSVRIVVTPIENTNDKMGTDREANFTRT
ncbi:hypothetical protein H5A21_19495 [Pectobacterium aquaticum]|nr:YhfG family protein [Pectobacterium aquaticum]MBN3066202.1 hypothetical protein [Pectobacterium aquaticum]